jgi:sporulation protein YlmC with PRC-barrel domain
MKKFLAIALYALPLAITPTVFAQTSSTTPATTTSPASPAVEPGTSGVTDPTMAGATPAVKISGWSVKHAIMGKSVYNEQDKKIGSIKDVVLQPDGRVSSFVVEVGGFLGMGEHTVAVPFDKVTKTNDKLVLAGYTKDQLKALPDVKITK